jgi:hypothetical protein
MIRLCVDPGQCAEVCSMAAAYSDMAAQRNGRELYIPTGARLVEAVKP